MTTAGQPMANHRVDKGGGCEPGAKNIRYATIIAANPSLANPGVLTIDIPRGFKIKTTGSPWTATLAGWTGVDSNNVNGSRTLTRVSDTTVSIGVDTSLFALDATDGTQSIIGIPLEDDDAGTPSSTVKDFE